MKINVVAVGNLKDAFFKDAQAEYLKRLSRYATVKVKEIEEEIPPKESEALIEKTKIKEGEKILSASKGTICLTAVRGDLISSEELASFIKKECDQGHEITFIIGGSYGTSNEVYASANKKISFGRITLPHRLMRVVLLEQIYRAFTIINGTNYHK